MAFVSMQEVLKNKLKKTGGGRRTNYNLLAISRTDLGEKTLEKNPHSYKSKIAFYLTEGLVGRAQLTAGMFLDFQFDFKNKEGVLIPVTTGGRTLCKGKTNIYTVYYGYFPGYGFPLPAETHAITIPDGHIHINKKGIVFNLKDVPGFIYETDKEVGK